MNTQTFNLEYALGDRVNYRDRKYSVIGYTIQNHIDIPHVLVVYSLKQYEYSENQTMGQYIQAAESDLAAWCPKNQQL